MNENTTLFTSKREKRIWACVIFIVIGIFCSLFVGQPLLNMLKDQNLQAVIFLIGLFIIGVMIIVAGLVRRANTIEWLLLLGISVVYIMFFLRLGLSERSHLIEYSALAITIHQALIERAKQIGKIRFLNVYAILISIIIGIIDELVQIALPDRVFDFEDILFNSLASFMAIATSVGLQFIQKR